MASDDTKLTVDVQVDSEEVIQGVKEIINNDDGDVIQQDTLLFKLMMHYYDEEVARNELIDSKNSQMIAFLGIIFTIQLTLFVNVLSSYLSGNVWPLYLKMISCILLIAALWCYIISISNFIEAYSFCGEFKSAPKPSVLLQKSKDNIPKRKLLKGFLNNFPKIIEHNDKLMKNKVKKANEGFDYLKRGGFLSIVFVIIILSAMILF